MKVMYAADSDYKLGREKRVVVKKHGEFKYIHIYDNKRGNISRHNAWI